MRRPASPTMVTTGPVTQLRPGEEVSAPAPPRAELEWPKVRGYAVHEIVGTGGMGVVFRATHRELQRVVALKMLMTGSFCEDESRDRFKSEAELVARLQHPNIVQVFEIGAVDPLPGEHHPSPFIALEFVEGGCLADKLKVPQSPQLAARLVEKLARATQVAHHAGIVHRDLKPANVLLTADGEPKIADFGLAKRLDAPRDNNGRFVTLAGTVMGTPEYMAPEQVAGEGPAPSMDVYALGVILYELLTARIPHHGATPADTMYMTRFEEPVSPRRLQPNLPRDIDTICMKALAKSPLKRYPTADALADDLHRWLEGRTIQARPVSAAERAVRWAKRNPAVAVLSALVVLVGVLGVGGIVWKWRDAKDAAASASASAAEARRNEATADANAKAERWGRYRADMIAAASALRVNEVAGARRAVMAAPEEHRDWEWRYFLNRLEGHAPPIVMGTEGVGTGQFSADLKRLLLIHGGGRAACWNLTTGERELDVERLPEWAGVYSFLNSNCILTHRPDKNEVDVWSISPRRKRATVRSAWGGFWSFSVSADGAYLGTGTGDGVARVWEVESGTLIRTFPPHHGKPGHPVFSPDGRRVVTSGLTDTVARVWDVTTGAKVCELTGHERHVSHAMFTPDGRGVVTNEHYPVNAARIFDAATGKLQALLKGHDNQISRVEFDPTGRLVATVSMDQTARLWDRAGKPVAVLKGHTGFVRMAAFSPDGRRLVTGGADKTVRLWDTETGQELGIGLGHAGSVEEVAYSADGREVWSMGGDCTLRKWDTRKLETNNTIRGHTNFAYSVAYFADGKRVLSGSWDGTARIWDVDTGRELRRFDHGPKAEVMCAVVHPDNKRLATVSRDHTVRLWDAETGVQLRSWQGRFNDWRDTRIAFSPDGARLAACDVNHTIRVFDTDTGAESPPFPKTPHACLDVAFHPNGRHIVGTCWDGTVYVWDIATRTEVAKLTGQQMVAYAVAFSRDGKVMATGSTDGTIRLYDAETYSLLRVMTPAEKVYAMAFTPDGKRLATGCADNTIRFWDVATGDEVGVIRGHKDYVHSIAYSPDGVRLVSASGDFTLRVWDAPHPK